MVRLAMLLLLSADTYQWSTLATLFSEVYSPRGLNKGRSVSSTGIVFPYHDKTAQIYNQTSGSWSNRCNNCFWKAKYLLMEHGELQATSPFGNLCSNKNIYKSELQLLR